MIWLHLAADLLGIVTGTALAGGVCWLVERLKRRKDRCA